MEEALKEYDLHVVESTEPDRRKIDFRILDDHNAFCAEISGDNPNDVEIDCEHPMVEFDDDEHVGECPICGAWATWHWEESADNGYTVRDKCVDSWDYENVPGGILGKYLKDLQGDNNDAL